MTIDLIPDTGVGAWTSSVRIWSGTVAMLGENTSTHVRANCTLNGVLVIELQLPPAIEGVEKL